mmetsp:Transcript_80473/g.227813  ORF Transcript_80473/g.227813 Transcript_80473/m.227813 type:complete len:270 (-) Transcript_80473:2-811(-)
MPSRSLQSTATAGVRAPAESSDSEVLLGGCKGSRDEATERGDLGVAVLRGVVVAETTDRVVQSCDAELGRWLPAACGARQPSLGVTQLREEGGADAPGAESACAAAAALPAASGEGSRSLGTAASFEKASLACATAPGQAAASPARGLQVQRGVRRPSGEAPSAAPTAAFEGLPPVKASSTSSRARLRSGSSTSPTRCRNRASSSCSRCSRAPSSLRAPISPLDLLLLQSSPPAAQCPAISIKERGTTCRGEGLYPCSWQKPLLQWVRF